MRNSKNLTQKQVPRKRHRPTLCCSHARDCTTKLQYHIEEEGDNCKLPGAQHGHSNGRVEVPTNVSKTPYRRAQANAFRSRNLDQSRFLRTLKQGLPVRRARNSFPSANSSSPRIKSTGISISGSRENSISSISLSERSSRKLKLACCPSLHGSHR